ncbi:MAG TPA: hypothetical protein DCL69_04920, partial [Firmicutes bacterium]|nr:hypothetical protein [Bacillota bacterium]
AVYMRTGMLTSPKLMAPFQSVRKGFPLLFSLLCPAIRSCLHKLIQYELWLAKSHLIWEGDYLKR